MEICYQIFCNNMTQTINIKTIIIAYIAAAVIALALAMGHRSVSHTKVQLWQADTTWVNWNRLTFK